MTLYDKLIQRKRRGEKLDIKLLTYELLHQLWWENDCSDGDIADLFDVAKKKITNLRLKWDMKVPETIVKEIESRWDGSMPEIAESTGDGAVSTVASILLRKLNGLNDLELETVRLALGRRFTAFADVKNEADFMNAVEGVIRQFGKS